AGNVAALSGAARSAGGELGVLVEVDTGMNRCGVEPGEPALALARTIAAAPGLRFVGLQGYDGHLQLLPDPAERRAKCHAALEKLVATRRLIESAGLPVEVVTGGGTGTWEFVAEYPGITEIQPGSFLLMDAAYHAVRPEFACSLSVMATDVRRRPGRDVLAAGGKASSEDFGMPVGKGQPEHRLDRPSGAHSR